MPWRPAAWREALTPEFGYLEAWIAWALRGVLAALAAYSLAVTPQYTTRPLLVTSALLGLAISLAFAFIPTRRPRTLKGAECAVLGMFVLHVIGHALGFYARFVHYDKVLHFVEPITIAITFYALSQSTDWIWQWRRVTPAEVFVYCWAMVVALGALWEILEFGMDTFFHTQEQNGNTDTMLDLLFDTLGGLAGSIAVAVATRHGREHGFDAVSEEPKSGAPRRVFRKRDVRG
ncbi:MAG: hypothetical protein QOE90_1474 [Thermoplasmata archaeon]|jgi:hypothetical protein|nr:hypothetical protein [Thermoplasmata archaeon]